MKIGYLHGFGSRFDPDSDKLKHLSVLTDTDILGIDLDYTKPINSLVDKITKAFENVDMVVGTSMGGYYAAKIGALLGVPFVAINPATNPKEGLKSYLGEGTTYYGEPFILKADVVDEYTEIEKNGCGLILLDEADDVIDSFETMHLLNPYYEVCVFGGGNHRFEHMKEAIPVIKTFYNEKYMYGDGC